MKPNRTKILTSFTLFQEHQESELEKDQRQLRAAILSINRDRDLDIIDITLKYSDAWTNWTVTTSEFRNSNQGVVIDFELWHYKFDLYLNYGDLTFNDFYNNGYQVEIPAEQEKNIVTRVLHELKKAIVAQPGLWSELPPRLQDYYRADFKEVGSDFDFFG